VTKIMKASALAIQLIKGVEGWSATPYKDGGGKCTIGWGHLVEEGEFCPDVISVEQGERYLADDIADAEFAVRSTVTVPLKSHQFDALVSFLFNVGPTAWAKSDTLKILNAGEYHRIPARLMLWNKITVNGKRVESEGLINRRLKEADLWRGK
jgi:lysozyme